MQNMYFKTIATNAYIAWSRFSVVLSDLSSEAWAEARRRLKCVWHVEMGTRAGKCHCSPLCLPVNSV